MQKGFSRYILSRLIQNLVVLLVVATVLFLIFRLMPGNPLVAFISPTFTKEQQEALMARFGLDKPLWDQYVLYMKNLLHGNLGTSFFQGAPVWEVLMTALPNTLYLTLTSIIAAYIIGVLGGVSLAWKRGSRFDVAGTVFTLMTRAAPQFWVGMLLLAIFSFNFQWLPSGGIATAGNAFPTEIAKLTSLDFWRHLFLPMVTSTVYLMGLPLLLMRSNMMDVLEQDFITMSRMKGFSEWYIMLRHVARNAVLPVATTMALGIGYAIGGNVVIENVFSWPGVGRLLVKAVSMADYPLAQGSFLMMATVMISMNFVADLLYLFLDPRVTYGGRER